MALIQFLEAAVPLTKTFIASKTGVITKDAYPLVTNITNHAIEINTPAEFFKAIALHADLGHCLLKGALTRNLVSESRRGTTRTDDVTSWICLDFDRHECASIDEALVAMGVGDVTYVLQYSASHGLPGTEGTQSAHVFMLMDGALPAPDVKAWLMDMNLKHFRDTIHLSRTKNLISWPLDITTCQNDKLLYIAAPTFKGMKDPLKQRITLVTKKLNKLPVSRVGGSHINALKVQERKLLNELRKAEDLPARSAKTTWIGATEVHNKPDVCTVTGLSQNGEFVRLNLNGGDSWAYWHAVDNFELIHDFKSDTWYKTKELVPGYYQQLIDAKIALNATPTDDGDLILAFRDLKTAEYFNGLWNPAKKNLELYRAKNETQLDHWMRSHGRIMGDYIPIWDIVYEPRQNWIVDEDAHRINLFVPSPYMELAPNPSAKFPVILGIIEHMLGCVHGNKEDDALVAHFLNWFACIFQRKHKPLTAWVTHGIEGCLAGDTEINFRRGNRSGGRPLTIKEAYEKFNGLWSATGGKNRGKDWDRSLTTYAHSVRDDFTIGYHEVFRIVESGVKKLYRVVTNDGGLIRVTHEHPFMRPDGVMTKLCDLKIGDIVLKRGEKNQHVLFAKGRNKQRKTIHSIQYHPYAWQHMINGKNYKRAHKARLVWEADLNDMSLEQFVNILRNHPARAETLQYLDPSIVVHHVDEDCTNDSLSNLAIVEKLNHDQHHAKTTGLGTVLTREARIVSITEDGEEMTYDMTMKAPYHNYVANDFCVSNTGKGYFINKIAMALLGAKNSTSVTITNVEDSFNGWLEGKLLAFIDEVDIDDFRDKGKITARLRNYITEPTMTMRRMRQQAVDVPNHVSFIFSSNRPQPVYIPETDRRYNVGNFQRKKLARPDDDAVSEELAEFAQWLLAQKASVSQANSIMQTDARERIAKLSVTSITETCNFIKNGDFDSLWLAMPDELLMSESNIRSKHTDDAQAYGILMRRLLSEALNEPSNRLTRDEMMLILQYNVGNMPPNTGKFTSLLRHNGIETKQIRRNGMKTYGIDVEWKVSDELRAEFTAPPKSKLRKVK